MYSSSRIIPNVLQSLSSASVTGSYQPVGFGSAYPGRLLKILNNSTEDVTVSWDGQTDHDYVPAKSFVLYDFGIQKSSGDTTMEVQQGLVIYVKGSAGTGNIYVMIFSPANPGNNLVIG